MKMFVALISGVLLSSAAIAQHEHGASTGGGSENGAASHEPAGEGSATSSNSNANAAATGEASEQRICRRVDRTGSRMSRDRLCMTARQWREFNRDN